MIDGVKIKKLKVIPDDRGRLMEILRSDDEIFEKFGQVYMTTVLPGIAKAWHYHKLQKDNFSCINGKIRLAVYDARKGSPSYKEVDEFILSLDEPALIQIPPMVYHGFKCIGDSEAIVINTVTEPYNRNKPDEYRLDAYENDIPYDWKR
ncbi:MAG: dTDP-4-dehydrorhamnose 3,5-epimerase family protein [Candidatus Omnitrophica bacterium]|nr:dTDP-4-dehydrorhamnose 3,5-epimerase family protein [Candidatus Omnitrophota bacterium]